MTYRRSPGTVAFLLLASALARAQDYEFVSLIYPQLNPRPKVAKKTNAKVRAKTRLTAGSRKGRAVPIRRR